MLHDNCKVKLHLIIKYHDLFLKYVFLKVNRIYLNFISFYVNVNLIHLHFI